MVATDIYLRHMHAARDDTCLFVKGSSLQTHEAVALLEVGVMVDLHVD